MAPADDGLTPIDRLRKERGQPTSTSARVGPPSSKVIPAVSTEIVPAAEQLPDESARWVSLNGLKALFMPPVEQKSTTVERATALTMFGYGRPYISNWDVQRAVTDGYERVVWVFRCVDAIAMAASGLEMMMRVGHPTKGKPIDDHPALELLNVQANPWETGEVFMYRLLTQFELSKKGVFVEVVYNNVGEPTALYLLPPHLTWPIPDAEQWVSGFQVFVPGQTPNIVPARDPAGRPKVIWIRKPHPIDTYSGVTPMEAGGLTIDTDYYMRLYQRTFMANDARPGGIVAVKGNISPEDADIVRQRFSATGAAVMAGKTAVIQADQVSWIDLASKPRDAQYVEGRDKSKEEILLLFGTPESVLGNASGRTYDNADAEWEVWWRSTMLGKLRLIASFLNQLSGQPAVGVPRRERMFTLFDTSEVYVLGKDQRDAESHAKDMVLGGLWTPDEGREKIGLDRFDVPKTRALWFPTANGNAIPAAGDEDAVAPVQQPQNVTHVHVGGAAAEAVQPPAGAAEGSPTEGPTAEASVGNAGGIQNPAKQTSLTGDLQRKEANVSDGVMVALFIPPPDARQLVVAGGEPADILHLTLAYLGGTGDVESRDVLAQAVASFASTAAPLDGTISGYGVFTPPSGTGRAFYASFDSPALTAWRQRLVASLEAHGLTVPDDHGFTAHITLAYLEDGDPVPDEPPTLPLHFDKVTVAWGAAREDFTLAGEPPKAANARRYVATAAEPDTLEELAATLKKAGFRPADAHAN